MVGLGVRWADFDADVSGRDNCAEMMAGSTGAPETVGCPEGGRLAGGVYLFGWPLVRGLYTPLYLCAC